MASLASVRLNPDGTFGPAVWTNLSDPCLQAPLTADAVEGNQVVGIGIDEFGNRFLPGDGEYRFPAFQCHQRQRG